MRAAKRLEPVVVDVVLGCGLFVCLAKKSEKFSSPVSNRCQYIKKKIPAKFPPDRTIFRTAANGFFKKIESL